MLTIGLGVCLHGYRVLFGDQMTLQHAMTPTTDRLLLIPMTYAAVTGIMLWRNVKYTNKAHRVFFTWALAYIALSVPLHVYCSIVRNNVDFYVEFFPMWFSYLLFPFYAALLTMFWRLKREPVENRA